MIAFLCLVASITDGDTLRCSNGTRVRIAGIDAPEMAGHCRTGRQCTPGDPYAARNSLIGLAQGKTLRCNSLGRSYDRILATCSVNGIDVGCYQVTQGHAVKRYSESWRVCRSG